MTYSIIDIAHILAEYSQSQLSLTKFATQEKISRFALKKWLDGDLPSKRYRRIVKPMDEEMESGLAAWITSEREQGNPVSRTDIRDEAYNRARERGHLSFNASPGWLTRFLRRHDFTERVRTKAGRKFVYTAADIVRSSEIKQNQQSLSELQLYTIFLLSRPRKRNFSTN